METLTEKISVFKYGNETPLVKRIKSLAWRIAMVVLAMLVDWALVNLELLDLAPQATIFLGLILGEVSKYLNVEVVNKGVK